MKIIDIHCHPATKVNFGHDISRKHNPMVDLLPTGMHVDIEFMKKGEVAAAVSVHYIIEDGFFAAAQNGIVKFVLKIANLILKDKLKGLREDKSSPDQARQNTIDSIQKFETAINIARDKGHNVVIPKNFLDFQNAWNQEKIIFLHSIEGGHSLGNNQDVFTNEAVIDQFARAGVCQLTIAHFFENIIVGSQGGIPPKSKGELGIKVGVAPTIPPKGLNPNNNLGESIIKKLLDVGIIIDLVHCPTDARKRIFEINKLRAKPRPLVFSHSGVETLFIEGKDNKTDKKCCPSEAEVKEIIACKGVIGVILMNYWLNGTEEDNLFKVDGGLQLIIKTIIELRRIGGGSCDHIAIGSDLDGFTQVPDDLATSAQLQLIPIELAKNSFTEQEIRKICHENYLRVLQLGWGN
jgi:microsomal dipeptidase-like Zn-dependent dipeptidase